MKKCKFIKPKIKLLSYQISIKGTISDPEKMTAIKALEKLTIIFKLRKFLGIIGFFRKYI